MRGFAALLVSLAVGSVVLAVPAPLAAANDPLRAVSVSGSPFYPNGDGNRERVLLSVRLNTPAQLAVDVIDFDGSLVRSLLTSTARAAGRHGFSWAGRDSDGRRVADGPYRFRVTATGDGTTETAEARFTKAPRPIYPVRPQAIVVAVDPGHGDVYSEVGRVMPDGTREAAINLDIGLRLRDMLEGAGVRTTISRTTDQGANMPEWDRNEDGLIEYADELQARCDIANAGRADLFVSIHNNIAVNPGVGGPATYYWPERPFAAQSFALATLVQQNMLARLDLYRTDTWYPKRSHGVLTYPYFVLHQQNLPRHPRATLMPGVLSEGLFLSHPYELSLLKQGRVRQSMAAAYYDAIQAFLAQRPSAVGYSVVDAPVTVAQGATADFRIRLINKGMLLASGWRLEARYVPAVLLYDGSDSPGELLSSTAVPDLGKGNRAIVNMSVPAPPPGEWLVKFDVVTAKGTHLTSLGSPPLQLPLSVSPAP